MCAIWVAGHRRYGAAARDGTIVQKICRTEKCLQPCGDDRQPNKRELKVTRSGCSGGFERLHVADRERAAQTLERQRSDFLDIGSLGDCGGNSGSNQDLSVLGNLA